MLATIVTVFSRVCVEAYLDSKNNTDEFAKQESSLTVCVRRVTLTCADTQKNETKAKKPP